METHNEDRVKFECSECGKTCSNLGNLKRHMEMHAEDTSRVECSECGKTFGRQASLRDHMKTHAEDRLKICGVCQAPFTSM